MKNFKFTRGLALLMSGVLVCGTGAGGFFRPAGGIESRAYTERTATVSVSGSLNVRSGPGTSYAVTAKLSSGTAVAVIGEQNASDGALWYQIRFTGSGGQVTGYASSAYIKFPVAYTSDADFEAYLNREGFPESYKPGLRQLHAQYPAWVFRAQNTGLDWNTVIENEAIVGRNLVGKGSISSWKSTETGAYDWDNSSWPSFDGGSWVAASQDIIRYYMDPRNFLDETYIFQFLLQSYDSAVHTREGLETLVSGTFLSGTYTPGSGGGSSSAGPGGSGSSGPSGGPGVSGGSGAAGPGGNSSGPGVISPGQTSGPGPQASISGNGLGLLTEPYGPGAAGDSQAEPGSPSAPDGGSGAVSSASYLDAIMNAGAQSGVNPYVLAAMILQEQGRSGSGGCISGRESGYEGYYNFFNIEAYASGSLTPVQRGLWYASQSGSYERPWNSPERSILGGAVYYGNNYVKAGQDTFYLKKFNVQGDNIYKHQYMTNIQAAAGEASELSKAYTSSLKQTALEFKIPVYQNMPESACAKPMGDGSPNNKLSNLYADGFVLTPTFSRDTESYDLIVNPSVSSVTIQASALDSRASISGTGTVQLQSGSNDVAVQVKAENGTVRTYTVHVVRQSDGPTYTSGVGGSGGSGGPGETSGPGVGGPGTVNPDGSASSGGAAGGSLAGPSGDSAGSSSGGSVGSSPAPMSPAGGSSAGEGNSQGAGQSSESAGSAGGGGSPSQEQAPAGSSGLKGDVNGDGSVTVLDATMIQRHLLGLETLSGSALAAADVNGDGAVNVMDMVTVQRDILGIQ